MPKVDKDTAFEIPIYPLIDNTDFKSLEEAIAYNAAGMSVDLFKAARNGVITKTDITPTTGSTQDWAHKGNSVYGLEITAAQNNTIGELWVVGICDGVLVFESPIYEVVQADLHTWYVEADNGSDDNSGHYWWDAKATISAAITAAAAGDTIKVGPGTYAEGMTVAKGLNILGMHSGLTKVTSVVISSDGDNVYIENIAVDSSASAAWSVSGTNVHLHRCTGICTGIDGLIFGSTAERIRLTECYYKSGYDGLQASGAKDVLIDRCILESTGANGSVAVARGFASSTNCRRVIIKNTIMIATTTQGVPVWAADAQGLGISFVDCTFMATASVRTADMAVGGLRVKGDSSNRATALCVNGTFDISKGSPNYGILSAGYSDAQAFNCNGTFETATSLSSSCTTQSATPKSKFKDSTYAALPDDFFNGFLVTWTSGSNTGESKYVTDWDQSDNEYYFGDDFTNDIEVGDAYTIAVVNHTAFCSAPTTGQVKISHIDLFNGTIDLSAIYITPLVNSDGDVLACVSNEPIQKLLRADKVIDTDKTPWTVDYKQEGTETKLMSKTMKNTAGENVLTANNVLGRLVQE